MKQFLFAISLVFTENTQFTIYSEIIAVFSLFPKMVWKEMVIIKTLTLEFLKCHIISKSERMK